jgi:hypothetical protein
MVVFFCVMVAVFAVAHLLLYLLLRELHRELAKIDQLSRKRIDALRQVRAQQIELIEKYRELRSKLRR